ncbi:hypothetical protein IFM89_033931 [Coptis chinensis]|uniref:Uncharacterized protein n=1 Tax=Coptis chinensis TaxID=261450 RepID=A0A835LTA2_9MAGN|nr:hypothetical protein IFM89_033931 [Coptis chinensis]
MAKKPNAPQFEEDDKDPLLDISSMTNNKELWLIQWPVNQNTDLDGQEITLKLQRNGNFASFETLSGAKEPSIAASDWQLADFMPMKMQS